MTQKDLPDPLDAIKLANDTMKEWDEKKIDPLLAYAALGSAFLQLHMGLGHGKKQWIKLTTEMSDYFPE